MTSDINKEKFLETFSRIVSINNMLGEYLEKIHRITTIVNDALNLNSGDDGYISELEILDLLDIEYKRELLTVYRMYCASSDRDVWADIIRVRVFDDIPSWFRELYSERAVAAAVTNVTGILGITDHPWY